MNDYDNERELGKVANAAYHWHGGGYSHQRDAFEHGFEEGVRYALDYAKLNDDGITLSVRPLPGCAFPNPFLDGSENDE